MASNLNQITFQHRLEFWGFRTLELGVRFLPEKMLPGLASILSALVFHIIKYRKEVTLKNLSIAFPEKTEEEREKIARRCYFHFALLVLEFLKLTGWNLHRLEQMIEFENQELIKEFAQQSKGVVVASGHFGNWEVAIAVLARKFWNGGAVIQQRQKNRLVDQRTVEIRQRWGLDIIYSRGALRQGLAKLASGKLLALLCDQDGGKQGVFVPFFGRMSSTPVGAAVLHLRSKAPLVVGVCVRIADFKYKIFWEPVDLSLTQEGVTPENIEQVTAAMTAILEQYVRQYPEQYLWMHRRWKTPYQETQKTGERV